MWAQEVADLQAKFPSSNQIFFHFQNDSTKKSWNKPIKKVIAPCCKASLACLVSSAQSCLSTSGVAGVLNMIENSIHWGFARKTYVCECIEHMNELDCEASAALAVKILRSVQFIGKEDDLQFVPVQLIGVCNDSHITVEKNQFKQQTHDSEVPWMAGSYYYHVAVGIISPMRGTIKIWDFGTWLQPYQEATEDCAIVSMRVDSSTAVYDWLGTKLVANQWTRTGDGWNKKRNDEDSSHFTLPRIKNVPLPTVINAPILPNKILIVYVSGCHMSANPCSGVGKYQILLVHPSLLSVSVYII